MEKPKLRQQCKNLPKEPKGFQIWGYNNKFLQTIISLFTPKMNTDHENAFRVSIYFLIWSDNLQIHPKIKLYKRKC